MHRNIDFKPKMWPHSGQKGFVKGQFRIFLKQGGVKIHLTSSKYFTRGKKKDILHKYGWVSIQISWLN